jgi:hypothetical protein
VPCHLLPSLLAKSGFLARTLAAFIFDRGKPSSLLRRPAPPS